MKKITRSILMVMLGIVIFGALALATTTLTNSNINVPSAFSQYLNISSLTSTDNATMLVSNSGTDHAVMIDQNGNTSSSTSVGGAVFLDNTNNIGAGLIIYSNQGTNAGGRLLNVRADNSLFPQDAVHIDNDGIGDALSITSSDSNTAGSNAISVSYSGIGDATVISTKQIDQAQGGAITATCSNTGDSCIDITGNETGRGTIKVTHKYPGSSDANAAALSIDTQGGETAAQGLFITSTGNSSGNFITVTNVSSTVLMSLNKSGSLKLGASSGTGDAFACIDANGNIFRKASACA